MMYNINIKHLFGRIFTMVKKRYAHVGIGGRARMYYQAIAKTFNETAELVAFCDVNKTRM